METKEELKEKIKKLDRQQDRIHAQSQALWNQGSEIQKQREKVVMEYFKVCGFLSRMTWRIDTPNFFDRFMLSAKEDWIQCPQELVDILKPSYHEHYSFDENEIEGVKFKLHFDDGEISLEIILDEGNTNINDIQRFLELWKIKVDLTTIENDIIDHQKKIDTKQKIINSFNSIREKK
ncbi:MAG: hypothetical protein ACTSSP_00475 [Candidatus Asgardarchaeia archaeon]